MNSTGFGRQQLLAVLLNVCLEGLVRKASKCAQQQLICIYFLVSKKTLLEGLNLMLSTGAAGAGWVASGEVCWCMWAGCCGGICWGDADLIP